MLVRKMRPGLYRIDGYRIEHQPNPEYSKSKPWILVDESEVMPNPIGRFKTKKEAIEQVKLIKEFNND